MDNQLLLNQGLQKRAKADKLKKIGIGFSLLSVVFSLLVMGGNSLQTHHDRVQGYFYEIPNELSVESQVAFIWGQGSNAHLVASQQNATHPLVQTLGEALDYFITVAESDMARFGEMPAATVGMIEAVANLDAGRGGLNLTESDHQHLVGVMANMTQAAHIINNSDFNPRVRAFNDTLSNFPANIIGGLRGIRPLPVF